MAAGILAVHDRLSAIWRPLASVAVLIAAAEAAKWAGLLPVFVPAPSQVAAEIVNNPRLVYGSLGPTAWKAGVGYCISAVIAVSAASIAVLVRVLYNPRLQSRRHTARDADHCNGAPARALARDRSAGADRDRCIG